MVMSRSLVSYESSDHLPLEPNELHLIEKVSDHRISVLQQQNGITYVHNSIHITTSKHTFAALAL